MAVTLLLLLLSLPTGQDRPRPYRLSDVDIKERRIWGQAAKDLMFGGQDQDAPDGRPHTHLKIDGKWVSIHEELRGKNANQGIHDRLVNVARDVAALRARVRHEYLEGLPGDGMDSWRLNIVKKVRDFRTELDLVRGDTDIVAPAEYAMKVLARALEHLGEIPVPVTPEAIRNLRKAQITIEIAAEGIDAEPPARALDCGKARKGKNAKADLPAQSLVYDGTTGMYYLFGGDHLDYLTNDMWVFLPQVRRWFLRHPKGGAPPPRANHHMAAGDGTLRMTGGYTYSSSTGYLSGQYRDLSDGTWFFDTRTNTWSGGEGELVPSDTRIYRAGPFHPDFYLQGPRPDRKVFQETLKALPVNRWVATNPPYRPRLNRDWGTARIDTRRDLLLRWSGGHSAHGGTDVPHFHFATNRWELPFPVEFPLGQLYANTRYPDGFNFNLRPWITGHTYQNYEFDPPSGLMVKAGRPRHTYFYDPDLGDWVGRAMKPKAMQYNSCFYTLTLVATPRGVVSWDKNGRIHRYEHASREWKERVLTGDPLPGAPVDYSTIAYDPGRDRVWIIATPGYSKAYDGRIWSLDPKTGTVKAFTPEGSELAPRFATVDRCVFDPENDLLILPTYLKDGGDRTATPAYDPKADRWIRLEIGYKLGKRGNRTIRLFPTGRSAGVVYDPKRKLIWGTDTNSQMYALRLVRPK